MKGKKYRQVVLDGGAVVDSFCRTGRAVRRWLQMHRLLPGSETDRADEVRITLKKDEKEKPQTL